MAVTKEILTLAVETGDALLRNGAEVYRVEDTVLHILKAYEITVMSMCFPMEFLQVQMKIKKMPAA